MFLAENGINFTMEVMNSKVIKINTFNSGQYIASIDMNKNDQSK